MSAPRLAPLRDRLAPLRIELLDHRVYDRLDGVEALRRFMESHVFAVWDFMSLLKALQRLVCCVEVPWVPPVDSSACRLVNAIVMAEESDEDGQGGHASHFDLYLAAMTDLGASRAPIDSFVQSIREGVDVTQALRGVVAPEHVRQFVAATFEVIATGDPCAIASAFTFGREDLLPEVFDRVIQHIDPDSQGPTRGLRYYLDRHVELDGDEHGPMAWALVERLCGDDPQNWERAENAARRALQARIALWNGIRETMTTAVTAGRGR